MKRRTYFVIAGVSLLAVAAYSLTPEVQKVNAPLQCKAIDRAQMQKLATGELAALTVLDQPRPLPPMEFMRDGQQLTSLADFKGKAILMNFWATWCVPCRAEMPALSKLQASIQGQNAQVVAVSMDLGSIEKPQKFLKDIQADNLTLYTEPSGKMFQMLKTIGRGAGLPTTLLIDANGCEQAFLLGPADWGTPQAQKIMKTLQGQ